MNETTKNTSISDVRPKIEIRVFQIRRNAGSGRYTNVITRCFRV